MTKKVNEIKPNVNNDHPDEPYMGVQVGWSRNGSPNMAQDGQMGVMNSNQKQADSEQKDKEDWWWWTQPMRSHIMR